jgi:hypothetical protein
MLSIFEPKFVGNCKRIEELAAIRVERTRIVEIFQERNINITMNTVNAVLDGEMKEMSKTALPKRVVKDIEAEIDFICEGIIA